MEYILGLIPDISLETANKFYTFGWAASLSGAAITFAGVIFLMWGTRVRDIDFEHGMAVLNSEAATARERAGRFEERAAGLEKAAAELRRENLDLENAAGPRIFEQWPAGMPLKQYAGIEVFISVIPEFEARRFAGLLATMVKFADWIPQWRLDDPDIITDGVEIEYEAGHLKDDPNDPTRVTDWNGGQRQKEAAEALVEILTKQKIEARTRMIPFSETGRPQRPGISREALTIRVGAKPMQYFWDKEFPEAKALRENSQQWLRDMDRRFEDMRRIAGERPSPRPDTAK